MTSKIRPITLRTRLALSLVVSAAGTLLMTGCGLGTTALSSNATSAAPQVQGFSGKIMGGPNPIVGATVKIFTTGRSGGNPGYGVGEFLQEANQQGAQPGQDTAADGTFHFAGGYVCPAGQFLYIQSNGGDTGAGYNPKAMLVAALGRCEEIFNNGQYVGGYIYMNELSTVAAAYALGGFTAFDGSGATTTARIGAPPGNNQPVGCVADGGACINTSAAGLRHAFQNARNLVDPFKSFANTTLPQNPAASVPAQLINSIANVLVTCVNSDGTSSACQTLFGATGTDFTNGTIFQAAINLAKNPTLAGTGYTPAQLYAATTPQTMFYQPILLSAPSNYSIAITIAKGAGQAAGAQGLSYPASGTLDINDNYYVGNYDSSSQTVANAVSFKSDATLVSVTPNSAAVAAGNGASADGVGNFYLVGGNATADGVVARYAVDKTSAAISPGPAVLVYGNTPLISSAVDSHNNLWFGSYDGTFNELPIGAAAPTFSRATSGAGVPAAIAIDFDQNVWVTTSSSTANAINALENVGTIAAPLYNNSKFVKAYDFLGDFASGISFSSGVTFKTYVTNLSNQPGIITFTPSFTGVAVTGITSTANLRTGFTSPSNNQTDGGGIVWAADGTKLVKYTPSSNTAISLVPCTVTSTNSTTCASAPFTGVQSVSIDSTGSVWFVAAGSGTVSQIIGAAAPTWPLLAVTKFGVLPQ